MMDDYTVWVRVPTVKQFIMSASIGVAIGLYMKTVPDIGAATTGSWTGVIFDELVYRSAFVTLLAWLLDWRLAIALVALVLWPMGHLGYLQGLTWSHLTIAKELATHGLAGIAWGLLYYRYGFAAAITGHAMAHIALGL